MTETGYPETKSVLQAINEKEWHSYVSLEDVFYEYSTNGDFRKLIDSGRFKYVDGYVVINDEKYITNMESVINKHFLKKEVKFVVKKANLNLNLA